MNTQSKTVTSQVVSELVRKNLEFSPHDIEIFENIMTLLHASSIVEAICRSCRILHQLFIDQGVGGTILVKDEQGNEKAIFQFVDDSTQVQSRIVRKNFEFLSNDIDIIEKLATQLKAPSFVEAVRMAGRRMNALMNAQEKGRNVIVKDAHGSEQTYLLVY